MKKVIKYIWQILSWCYYPFYLLFWVLHIVARLLLALAYLGLLEKHKAKDIWKSLWRLMEH